MEKRNKATDVNGWCWVTKTLLGNQPPHPRFTPGHWRPLAGGRSQGASISSDAELPLCREKHRVPWLSGVDAIRLPQMTPYLRHQEAPPASLDLDSERERWWLSPCHGHILPPPSTAETLQGWGGGHDEKSWFPNGLGAREQGFPVSPPTFPWKPCSCPTPEMRRGSKAQTGLLKNMLSMFRYRLQ